MARCSVALKPRTSAKLKTFHLFFSDSKLPYDVTPEQAMTHEEVRTRLEASIKNMKTITDKFLSAIIVSVDKIPYVPRLTASHLSPVVP